MVDAAAAIALVATGLVATALNTLWQPGQLLVFLALLAGAAMSVEVYQRVGVAHRGDNQPYHVMLSVFYLAGALLLPPFLALLLIVPVQLLLQLRSVRLPAVKRIFNAANKMVACLLAVTVRDVLAPGGTAQLNHVWSMAGGIHGPVSVVASGITLVVVGEALLVGLLHQVNPSTPWHTQLGDVEDWRLNVVDLTAGIGLAVTWAVSPIFYLLALCPVVMLQRSAVHRHLVLASQTDAKTGVANPTHWRSVASRAVRRAQHDGGSLAVLMIDLDHFKQINDVYGHLVGDDVLSAVADTLQAGVRPGDLVGRFGGEEFAVLLAGASFTEAAEAATRIHQRIGALGKNAPFASAGWDITASLGVAVYGDHGHDLDQLLDIADRALYQAKADGRDRVAMPRPLTEPYVIGEPADSQLDTFGLS